MEAEIKQTNKKLGFLGNGIMHTRTGLPAHNQACVRRQDYAYRSPYLENKETQTQNTSKKPNSNNLACSELYTTLGKHT